MEQTKLKRFERILIILIFALLFNTIMVTNNMLKCSAENTKMLTNNSHTYLLVDKDALKDSITSQLINEVKSYLRMQSPKAHHFIPKYIVQAGLNNDIDICFMMAQTQIETNFGTIGAGKETLRRSLFGVSSKRYSNYEAAVNDYCRLLNKSYLGNGRTEQSLMKRYVTHGGARYASNPKYEAILSKVYKDIVKNTNIQSLQTEWSEL